MVDNFEKIQEAFCSNSRASRGVLAGRMGGRLTLNIKEAVPFFKEYGNNLPVLDIGCGDGWGMDCFKENGFNDIYGIEVVQSRIDTAKKYDLNVYKGVAENTLSILKENSLPEKFNIFCSHVLEHCVDQKKVIDDLKSIANIFWIIVPIEPKGTGNKAHFSPVANLEQISDHFFSNWTCLKKETRFNLEPEGVIGFVKKC